MISRRLLAATPLLLVLGIIAQVILLVAAVVVFIPAMIWPGILDGPYKWISRGMARIMAKMIVGKGKHSREPAAAHVTSE